ncbi:MAG: prepilin-type N-terminal cleavage/methylation domain-containing protein [Lentisphaerae bacterium]|nr:prepilin-type N-terminal cleavage/methylation domain-containing protein [Lentisphaerota bacterium]
MNCRRRYFTLIEMIVVLAIMVIAVAVVAAAFRGDDPAVVLDNTALDLESYLAQVRYRAAEMGRDYVVKYPYGGKHLIASPDYSRQELEQIELDNTDSIEEMKFHIPENCTMITESGAEKQLAQEATLEIFRFFPDGGGASANRPVLKCGDGSRSFDISFLSGRLQVSNEDFSETYVDPGEIEETVTEDEAVTVI